MPNVLQSSIWALRACWHSGDRGSEYDMSNCYWTMCILTGQSMYKQQAAEDAAYDRRTSIAGMSSTAAIQTTCCQLLKHCVHMAHLTVSRSTTSGSLTLLKQMTVKMHGWLLILQLYLTQLALRIQHSTLPLTTSVSSVGGFVLSHRRVPGPFAR